MNPQFGPRISRSAMCASITQSYAPPTWLLDSGASSHMTNSIANSQSSNLYIGPEQVYIGDGKGLPILHSGSSTIHIIHHDFSLEMSYIFLI